MSKKLRGHKPACKCVGCSAKTRRRGMKALGLRKNPLDKKESRAIARNVVASIRSAKKHAPKSRQREFFSGEAAGKASILSHYGHSESARKAGWKLRGKALRNPRRAHRNPLTGREAADLARRMNRSKKNALRLRGIDSAYYRGKAIGEGGVLDTYVDRKKRDRARSIAQRVYRRLGDLENPRRHGPYIGMNPTLRFDTGRAIRYAGKIYAGADGFSVVIFAPHSAGIVHHQVRAVEYDNRAKAMRAYGRPGRFLHKFTSPVSVKSPGTGIIVLKSSSRIWRTQ